MGDCKKCPFYKTEPVPEDLAGKVNLTEWSSCDVDAVGLAAADRIANQSTHIAALQQEIEKLRGQLPRWIPVDANLYPGGANFAGGCGGGNPRQAIVYVTNPDAPRNCCAGGFGSTKIGEEVE